MDSDVDMLVVAVEMPPNVSGIGVKNVVGFYDPVVDLADPGNFLERILIERAIYLLEMSDSPLRPESGGPIDPSIRLTGDMLRDLLVKSARFPTYPPGLLEVIGFHHGNFGRVVEAADFLRQIVPTAGVDFEKAIRHFRAQSEIWNLRAKAIAGEISKIVVHPDLAGQRWREAWIDYIDVMQRDAQILEDLARKSYSRVVAWIAIGEQTGKYLGHVYSTKSASTGEVWFHGVRKAPTVFLGITPGPAFHFANLLFDKIIEKEGRIKIWKPLPTMERIIRKRRDARSLPGGYSIGRSTEEPVVQL